MLHNASIIQDFQYNAKLLLDYDKSKLLKILNRHNLWRMIVVNEVTSDKVLEYINNINTFVDLDNTSDKSSTVICLSEIIYAVNYEKKIREDLKQTPLFNTTILTMKRKIQEYDVLINKLKNTLLDYKTELDTEYKKSPVTKKVMYDEINAEYASRIKEVSDPVLQESILEQVKLDISTKYSTDLSQRKFETYTAAWLKTQEQIDTLTKERDELKKLVNPSPVKNNVTLIPQYSGVITNYNYRKQELESILIQLYKTNAPQIQISEIINQLNELSKQK